MSFWRWSITRQQNDRVPAGRRRSGHSGFAGLFCVDDLIAVRYPNRGGATARPKRPLRGSTPGSQSMSIESVRAFFAEKAPEIAVIESPLSSATVALAAQAYGVEPGRIAKTLSLRIGERALLIVTSGTSRMDNRKLKARFGGKPKMLGAEEVAEITGHEVGGVCPFGLKTPLPIYCDVSLQAFDQVVPAAGSTHSAVRIAPSRMAELTGAEWVDVCETAG
jgi:prolyl-tRNA editing enzyme YbaK/EbsC (Cys-tRNA(Pro) deacylase)